MNKCLDKLKGYGSVILAFGKKNASSLMTGGGILLSWTALYMVWQESRKAEEKIRAEEEKLNEGNENESPQCQDKLPFKEKAIIYAQYCWPGVAVEILATVMGLYSHKLSMDEIAKWYMMSQFLEEKNEKQEKLLDKLKGEVDEKKMHLLENDILEEEYPKEEILDNLITTKGNGSTLFIDQVTHAKFKADILDVNEGIANVNEILRKRREAQYKKAKRSFDYVKDNVFIDDSDNDPYDPDVYSSIGLDVFLDAIGETTNDGIETRLDELLEFRYYGGGSDLIKPKDILTYKQYEDPATGIPAVCFVDYTALLSPSSELIERNPL